MSITAPPQSVALARDTLTLHWDDGIGTIAAATLRQHCRCAPCQSARLRGTLAAPTGDALVLADALPVGHYALQLRFADGHERGIYPWQTLRELAGKG